MIASVAAGGMANLGWLNLLVADMQTGFGPFISVRLTDAGWNTEQIGAVLSAGTIASVVAQVPAGLLVDRFANKRLAAAVGIVGTMLALLLIAARPAFVPVLLAEIASGFTGAVVVLGIAAITLTLTSRAALGERLGSNVRFAAIGAASGSVLLGLVGSWFSPGMVFVAAAACGIPALFVLSRLPGPALLRRRRTAAHAPPPEAKQRLLRNPHFLAFIACCAAFHLANAAQLPLAATEAAHRAGAWADIVTGTAITEPQIMVAAVSPWVGRMANRRGRRVVLLVGFCALPARALLFALSPTPEMVVGAQILDGVSAAVFGVLLPLVVADITQGGGRFNFALGIASVACALGAAVSNAAAGALAQTAGLPVAFLALAGLGAGAVALVWFIMPETATLPPAPDPRIRQDPA